MKIADLKADVLRISDIYAREHSIDRDRDWALLKLQEELGELTAEQALEFADSRTDLSLRIRLHHGQRPNTAGLRVA